MYQSSLTKNRFVYLPFFFYLPILTATVFFSGCDSANIEQAGDIGLLENVGPTDEIAGNISDTSDIDGLLLELRTPEFGAADPARPARLVVPGLIEAENHAAIRGTSSTVNVPPTEAGVGKAVVPTSDRTQYNFAINVTEAGRYNVRIRYANFRQEAPVATLLRNGRIELGSTRLSGTGSADNYQEAIVGDVPLSAGLQTLSLVVDSSGESNIRINWLYPDPIFSEAAAQHTITVDPINGADGSGNTQQTLPGAFDRVAQIIASDPQHGPIDVILEQGYHELSSTLRLDRKHAATMTGPVRVKGRSGAYVRVGAGRQIDASQFELITDTATLNRLPQTARGKVYRAKLDDSWDQRFPGVVSYNDVRQELARFPNIGFTRPIEITSDSFKTFEGIDGPLWAQELAAGGEMFIRGHIIAQEFIERDTVAAVSNDGRITFSELRDIPNSGRGPKLYIFNVLAALDTPGEYYYDKTLNELYLWPVTPLSTDPEIRVGGNFEAINGTDQAYLRFEGIHFQDNGLQDGGSVRHLLVLRGKGLQLIGNHFRNSRAGATVRLTDGHSNQLRSNDFYDVENGFVVRGFQSRELPFDGSTFSNAVVRNNHIYSTMGNGYGGTGVVTGVGGRYQNNLIHDVQGGAQFNANSDALYELNEVYDSGWENGDWNIFYHGVSYAHWGNVMRYNFFHNMVRLPRVRRAGAVRSDDGGQGIAYTGNVFYKTADYAIAYAGAGHTTTNNIAINTSSFLLAEENTLGNPQPIRSRAEAEQFFASQRNCTDGNKQCFIVNAERIYGTSEYWLDPHFRFKYPVAAEAYDTNPFNYTGGVVENNLAVNLVTDISGGRGEPEGFPFAKFERPLVEDMSIFKDPNVLDFSFNNSYQRPFGFRVIPFDQIGLFRDDDYRSRTPHKPTYRAEAKLRWQNFTSNSTGRRPDPVAENVPYYDRKKARTTHFDLGTYISPLRQNYHLLTRQTSGSYGWAWDLIFSSSPGTFEIDADNGAWYALVTLGDASAAHDQMSVAVEGQAGDTGINTAAGQFVNACAESVVSDGRLSVTISDQGGTDPNWVATRIIISKAPFPGCSNRILPGNAAIQGF